MNIGETNNKDGTEVPAVKVTADDILYSRIQRAVGHGITDSDFFDFLYLRSFLKDDSLTISPDDESFDPKTARERYTELVEKIKKVIGPVEGLELKQGSEA